MNILKKFLYFGLLGLSMSTNCKGMNSMGIMNLETMEINTIKNYALEHSRRIIQKYNEYYENEKDKELGEVVEYGMNRIVFELKHDPNKFVVFEEGSSNSTKFGEYMNTSCIVEFLKNPEIKDYGLHVAKIYKDTFVDNRGELANFIDFNIWYEMESISGCNLKSYVERKGCTCKQIIDWGIQLCGALKNLSQDGWTFDKLNISDIRLKLPKCLVVIVNFGKIANIKNLNDNRLKKINYLYSINNIDEMEKYKKIKDENANHLCSLISELSKYVLETDKEENKKIWDKLNSGLELTSKKTLDDIDKSLRELGGLSKKCLIF